jgi:hypothetical protein
MSFSTDNHLVAILENSELIGREWDLGSLGRNRVLSAAKNDGYSLLTDLGRLMEPDTDVVQGGTFLAPDDSSTELAFVRKFSPQGQIAFSNSLEHLLLIDKRGRAYTNIGLGQNEIFDGAMCVVSMPTLEALLWTWGWLNSQFESLWQEALETVTRAHGQGPSKKGDLLIPDEPRWTDDSWRALADLARLVNSDLWNEERDRSTYRVIKLEIGAGWHLREYTNPQKSQGEKLLRSMVKSVSAGTRSISKTQGTLPSTGGKWLKTGKIDTFQTVESNNIVLCNPGDVVTPSMGTVSVARITDRVMVLAKGHIALEPNSDATSDAICDFLNSRNAGQQRLQAVQSGIIPSLSQKALLDFRFLESTNLRSKIRNLMSGLVSN